jgi:hypothetical protein
VARHSRGLVAIVAVTFMLAACTGGCDRTEPPPAGQPAGGRVPKAVIVIHGVGNQTSGYSQPLQVALTASAGDLHFTEVLWSDLGSLIREGPPDQARQEAEAELLRDFAEAEQRAPAARRVGPERQALETEQAAARGYVGPVVRYEFLSAGERERIQQRFRAALEWTAQHADRTYVVAHSLGSVIAFDVLHAWEGGSAPGPVGVLCTLGSPLGKSVFAGRRGRPLTKPAVVEAWVNFYSSSDPIASSLAAKYANVLDREVGTSDLPLSAHTAYWTHQDVVADLTTRLR